MPLTVLLAFVAGFFAANGLPYYVRGSVGDGQNPSPFRDSPVVSVLVGWAAFAVAGVAWAFAGVGSHPLAGWIAAAVGVLAVGLIHARTWRDPDPWGKRSRNPQSSIAA